MAGRPDLSVVVPALDECHELPATLAALPRVPPLEVIVADGGSRDGTAELAERLGARVVRCGPGRARQMNAGAHASNGKVLVFLHADTRIGTAHLDAARAVLADGRITHGSFPIRIHATGAGYRLIETVANLRTRLDRTPYGDQALFVRRDAFARAGGFPELPIMEELTLARRLAREGRFAFLPGPPVLTSARRWERHGLLRTTLANWGVRALWELGVAPARLVALRARLLGERAAGEPAAKAREAAT